MCEGQRISRGINIFPFDKGSNIEVKPFGSPVDWRALRQHTVTTYTTEAELLAVSEAAKSLIWWKRVFAAIGFNPKHQMQIRCDNKQIMALLSKEDHHVCLKLQYVDIHQHWLRQKVQKGSITVNWVPVTVSSNMSILVDYLTEF